MQGLNTKRNFSIDEIAFKVEDLLLTSPLRIANENYSTAKTVVKQGLAEIIDSIKEESHDSVILVEGKRDKDA